MTFSNPSKEIYGIPGSGWTSPTWNWGYAQGTGHDCAAISRRQYSSRQDRQVLVQRLLTSTSDETNPVDIEELKLVLGLAFQRGRWDGSDGGPGGYSEVLAMMAQAERYEDPSEELSNHRLADDMAERYTLLLVGIDLEQQKQLSDYMQEYIKIPDSAVALRRCSGLVLKTMGFILRGL